MFYKISDKIHAYCVSDYTFEIEVEILAVIGLDHALEYDDVIRKLFNATGIGPSNYDELIIDKADEKFYLCKVLAPSASFNVDDKIILNDSIIDLATSYYLEEKFTIITKVSYLANNTNFRKREQLIELFKNTLIDNNITEFEIKIDKDDEEKRLDELAVLYNLVLKFKELEEHKDIIDAIKNLDLESINREFTNNANTLKKIIDDLVERLRELGL